MVKTCRNVVAAAWEDNMEAEQLREVVDSEPMSIVYFSNQTCGACEVIRNRIGVILGSYPKVKIHDLVGEVESRTAAAFDVYSYPLLILFVEGKETIRVGRNIDFLSFEKSLDRYYQMLGL